MSDVLPPPPPQRAGNNPWKWAFIGCSGCGCLAALVLIGFGIYVFNSPQYKTVMSAVELKHDLESVGTGLGRYVTEKKQYPPSLDDLVPTYVAQDRLYLSSDKSRTKYTYHKPPKDAEESFVMVEHELPSPTGLTGAPPWSMRLLKSGRVDGTRYTFQTDRGEVSIDAP